MPRLLKMWMMSSRTSAVSVMNNILLKVQQYLDSVSKGPVKLDKRLVQEFGEACKNALLKQFEEERRDKFELRMSNVGRPLCQLQMEAKGIKGEGQPYNVIR